MATFADDEALLAARLQVNAPQLARNNTAALMGFALSLISHTNDTQALASDSADQMFTATATGPFLARRAADFGVQPGQGSPSSATVVFKVPSGTAPATITINSGTVVSTPGDGISTIAQTFATQAIATISSGGTVSNAVSAVNTAMGVAGNVAQGTITVLVTPLSGVVVSNATGDGGTAATGGADPDSDTQIRKEISAATATKYGASAIQAAILAVPGVFDAYVNDPQDGSGTITFKWCDVNRAQVVATPTQVNAAVNAVLPPNITATGGTFTVKNLTALTLKYDAPAAVKGTAALEAAIKTAIVAYFQGLIHNQAPLVMPLATYINSYATVGGVLTNAILVSGTAGGSDIVTVPPTGSPTVIYGCSGGTAVVTLTTF